MVGQEEKHSMSIKKGNKHERWKVKFFLSGYKDWSI